MNKNIVMFIAYLKHLTVSVPWRCFISGLFLAGNDHGRRIRRRDVAHVTDSPHGAAGDPRL